jgi:hypothetical protein
MCRQRTGRVGLSFVSGDPNAPGHVAGLRAHIHNASWMLRISSAFWSFLTIFITPYGTACDAALEHQTRYEVGNDMYTPPAI